jgi:hypothetical protein
MTKQARAVVSIVESFPEITQREVVRAILRRFEDFVDEEEDRALAVEAERELVRWKRGGRKTIPTVKVRKRLEREGLL